MPDAVVDVGPGAAVVAQPCPPDILQRDKSSREYRTWYLKQWRRKRRAAADRGDAVAAAALLKKKKHREQCKQNYRKRCDAARRGDAQALAAIQKHREQSKQFQRKRAAAARQLKGDCKVAQSRRCQASPGRAQSAPSAAGPCKTLRRKAGLLGIRTSGTKEELLTRIQGVIAGQQALRFAFTKSIAARPAGAMAEEGARALASYPPA